MKNSEIAIDFKMPAVLQRNFCEHLPFHCFALTLSSTCYLCICVSWSQGFPLRGGRGDTVLWKSFPPFEVSPPSLDLVPPLNYTPSVWARKCMYLSTIAA